MKRLIFFCILLFAIVCASVHSAFAQGMPIDSMKERITGTFGEELFSSLRSVVNGSYEKMRVWGYATGDFSSDGKIDLALSLYDLSTPAREATVYLLQNTDGKAFTSMFSKKYSYVETPIEVGLAVENGNVYIIQKPGETEWRQDGYTIFAGDVITIDEYMTRHIELPAGPKKTKQFGYVTYRNYESLTSLTKYYDPKTGEEMLSAKYFSFPAYTRLRSVYPGYGHDMYDTTEKFIVKGSIYRRDDKDLSIDKSFAGYDDEYIYYSISVQDDQVWGGDEKIEKNDRVSLWIDTWQKGNRFYSKGKSGTLASFRTNTDSNIYNITFSLTDLPGTNARVTLSSSAVLTDGQQEAGRLIRALVVRDTARGMVTGYTLKARIPFAFLGFESNPVKAYEDRAAENMFSADKDKKKKTAKEKQIEKQIIEEDNAYPRFGFTAVVNDVDNPSHFDEVTQQATSAFDPNNPTTFGELILIPSSHFYGDVRATYMKTLTEEILKAGY